MALFFCHNDFRSSCLLSLIITRFIALLRNKTIRYQAMIKRRWTIQEETELKALLEGNLNIEEIAETKQNINGGNKVDIALDGLIFSCVISILA